MSGEKKDIFDRFMSLPGLRKLYSPYKKHKAILLYMLFGGGTTLVNILSFILFNSVFSMSAPVANLPAWVLAVLFAYITNRLWVFDSHIRGRGLWREIGLFFGGRLLTLGIEEVMLIVFVEYMKLNDLLIKILATIVVLVLNYIFSKLFVFKKK
jgi:putative flippase GtrA